MRYVSKILGISATIVLAFSSSVWADGYYDLFGANGDKWGEITYEKVQGEDTIWLWPNEEGEVIFFIKNPQANRGDWSKGTYDGYFRVDMPEEIAAPCGYAIEDGNGDVATEWGTARIEWTGKDEFTLRTWPCGGDLGLEVFARYGRDSADADVIAPVSAALSLQSDRIPISRQDRAFTVQGLDKNPAIYLVVEFSDGTSKDYDYKKQAADNIIFDDVSGDPNDIIEVVWWDIDSNDPSKGKYAAQLTSTGKGAGTATLNVSFHDAPQVTASVRATVVRAGN